ncbi:MAG: DoxX family protein [Sciscionella sp.]
MIMRRLARPLLAAVFVYGGIETLRNPEGRIKLATPFLDKTLGNRAEDLPDSIPTDPATLVRLDAAVKTGAGVALALNKFPRLAALLLIGSMVPTTLAGHAFWEHESPEDRNAHLLHFLKNASSVGGLMLAALDTEGKPSLGWRARRATKKANKRVSATTGSAAETVRGAVG